jgi:hypothetical protein
VIRCGSLGNRPGKPGIFFDAQDTLMRRTPFSAKHGAWFSR